ncbi:hypothetical protein BDV26DRAFT_280169 [Aspergillus bertholletiae]|uniref:Uncharacterized protein n=1 Tax=Aspergillus bertholletiae TaxID=1226010 RepID=A0A5N7BCW4_9EURO|nr:hypothetical protein BDV26DRAFT_280169 [Aspergillus bertholletiae]
MKCLQSMASLSKEQMRLLIRTLSIGFVDPNGSEPRDKEKIRKAIKKLPSALQRHWFGHWMDSIGRAPAVALCALHTKLNPYVTGYIFELLRCEVITHLECLCWYHTVLHDARLDGVDRKVRDIVHSLRDIRYMWTPSRRAIQGSPVTYQQNRCEACILARIVQGQKFLQHLRTALLSRIATRRNHRVPTFLPFVEESIACHEGFVDKIHWCSSTLATTMKRQRKHAHRARMTSNPIASLRHGVSKAVDGAIVPIGIDPEVLKSYQKDRKAYGGHGEPYTISEQVPKVHDSDTDTLAGIVGLYSEPQSPNWILSPTSGAIESQSDLSSVTYSDGSTTSTKNTTWFTPTTSARHPLLVLSPSIQQRNAARKDPADDANDGHADEPYIPPREIPLGLLPGGAQSIWWEKAQENGRCEQIAAQYRNLLSPAQPYYGSEWGEVCSESEYEDNPRHRESEETNWSFIFRL